MREQHNDQQRHTDNGHRETKKEADDNDAIHQAKGHPLGLADVRRWALPFGEIGVNARWR